MRILACALCLICLGIGSAFASEVVPGEYMVLFKAREAVMDFDGSDRDVAVSVMLDFQAEYLSVRYGVEVKNSFSAISRSSGKGMFFVISDRAAIDGKFETELLEDMRSDPFIEAVSPNEVQKMISTPVGTSKKGI
ncbi:MULTISPECIES: hypothetical protein [Dethiosulfovibrio]|uniref:Uncharacterized protein n=2 Tax=Dethiosulfovibrio TaxID=47054 RepID=A0ABS9EQJ8_9BACT|nr:MULTISPECIES: hypothetical protein [Dethiosulfovibrio]MCF4115090.1 hypothetical protein [Dethiosulfovibrio russensis]MCF4143468.1 hypothetical protein [Dethiosulfovibrio marinus]MCF4145717.1 hypothetical protein [Dethiosulfovibrio acidaminovorans]